MKSKSADPKATKKKHSFHVILHNQDYVHDFPLPWPLSHLITLPFHYSWMNIFLHPLSCLAPIPSPLLLFYLSHHFPLYIFDVWGLGKLPEEPGVWPVSWVRGPSCCGRSRVENESCLASWHKAWTTVCSLVYTQQRREDRHTRGRQMRQGLSKKQENGANV